MDILNKKDRADALDLLHKQPGIAYAIVCDNSIVMRSRVGRVEFRPQDGLFELETIEQLLAAIGAEKMTTRKATDEPADEFRHHIEFTRRWAQEEFGTAPDFVAAYMAAQMVSKEAEELRCSTAGLSMIAQKSFYSRKIEIIREIGDLITGAIVAGVFAGLSDAEIKSSLLRARMKLRALREAQNMQAERKRQSGTQ